MDPVSKSFKNASFTDTSEWSAGDTLTLIASEKAGIFKVGRQASVSVEIFLCNSALSSLRPSVRSPWVRLEFCGVVGSDHIRKGSSTFSPGRCKRSPSQAACLSTAPLSAAERSCHHRPPARGRHGGPAETGRRVAGGHVPPPSLPPSLEPYSLK
jgi:hypothetical protein